MTDLQIGLWSFPVLLALIFARIPIGLAMLVIGFGGAWLINDSPSQMLNQLKSLTYSTFSNHSLSIIPLFLLMGQFATLGGVSTALFKAAETWLGHRKGGTAMAAIGACAGFGAICGSSLATAATMGKVALPELRRQGYSGALSTGALAAGGTLGILIPPSVVLVIYAVLTEQNIAKLFVAALLPGALALLLYFGAIATYVRRNPLSHRLRERASPAERRGALIAIWPVLTVFIAVVGGIYWGIFSPTEAAAVGAFGTGLIALLGGALSWRGLKESLLETASATAMIFFIILGAAVFNIFLALTRLPQEAALFIASEQVSPWLVLAIILLIYLVLGCVMDSLSMILLTVPIFFPLLSGLDFGMSPEAFALWFGILVLVVVEVGLITPPVGLNLFVINKMADDVSLGTTYRGVTPFLFADLIRIAILAAFPILTLWPVFVLFD